MLRGNFREVAGSIDRFSERLKEAILETAGEAMDLIGTIAQAKYMIAPGGPGAPVHSSKLTVRSGRLIRSLSPQGGAFTAAGEREQIREVQTRGGKVVGIFGTRVPYAAIHEYGGTIPAMTIYPRKAKALHFFTKEGKEVFAKYANVPARTMPARPYLGPAAKEAEPKIVAILDGKIARIA